MVQEVSLVPNSSPPVVAKTTTLITMETKPINASAKHTHKQTDRQEAMLEHNTKLYSAREDNATCWVKNIEQVLL